MKEGKLIMRMLVTVRLPHETFNAATKDGTAIQKIQAILDDIKPEAVYFPAMTGQRSILMIVELEKSSELPALAEPWFLSFDADVDCHVVMTSDDFQEAGLEKIVEKWG